jgi:hypothetical protein
MLKHEANIALSNIKMGSILLVDKDLACIQFQMLTTKKEVNLFWNFHLSRKWYLPTLTFISIQVSKSFSFVQTILFSLLQMTNDK